MDTDTKTKITIDPMLLRACAAYLAHADAYAFEEGESACVKRMLRPIAIRTLYDLDLTIATDAKAAADGLTQYHLDRIYAYVAGPLHRDDEPGGAKVRAVARAILDAPMLSWWCETLERLP